MLKKILAVSLLGAVLIASTAGAVTLKEFFQEPMPNVVEFMDKVIIWLGWLWQKILYVTDVVLNWTLDSFLIYFWKVTVWFWNLVKTSFLAGWQTINAVAEALATGTDIDWQNIQWPWNEQ